MDSQNPHYHFGESAVGNTLLPVSAFSAYSLLRNCNYFLASQAQGSRSPTDISSCPSLYGPSNLRRQRGEKKPIPDEQKDDKYFERRKRNNQAAKKSRDARKMREDQVALRATILEHENAILRAQVLTLREEASSLRQLLLQKKALEIASHNPQIRSS
ncbi:hypothetical protein JTB14_012799 [Gonioctena quinquepunctata]|nr:hypothetical protein JTB14_012799 [Gonioctena quinquepunctata]